MQTYELQPLHGIGPIQFGMHRSAVHDLLGKPWKSMTRANAPEPYDCYFFGSFQISYDDNDRVEYIEVSGDQHVGFFYNQMNLFTTEAEQIIELMSQSYALDEHTPEKGYCFIFPDLELSFWRPVSPDYSAEGRFFSSVGLGKPGYYNTRAG